MADGKKEFYAGDDWESASDKDILKRLGYDHRKFHVVKREDGPCGGGGDDSGYITIDFGRSSDDDDEEDF